MVTTVGPVGRSKLELDTPVLLVDLPTMGRNIERMAGRIIGKGVNWRPHTKGQKVPALAYLELAAGAIGVTCAKLGEAEVMAAAGIRDILIANQIVGRQKVTRLVNPRPHADSRLWTPRRRIDLRGRKALRPYWTETSMLACSLKPGGRAAVGVSGKMGWSGLAAM